MQKDTNRNVKIMNSSVLQKILIFSGVNVIAILCFVYFFGAQYTSNYNDTIKHNIAVSLDDAYNSMKDTYEDLQQIGQLITLMDSTGYTGGNGALLVEWPEYSTNNIYWSGSMVMDFVQMRLELQNALENTKLMNATLGKRVIFTTNSSGKYNAVLTDNGVILSSEVEQIADLPIIANRGSYTFHSPHKSLFSQDEVISVVYKLNYRYDVYLYMETAAEWFSSSSNITVGNSNLPLVISNEAGTVLYSQNESLVSIGSDIDYIQQNLHLFSSEQSQKRTFRYHVVMEDEEYQELFNGWNQGFLWLCVGSFLLLMTVNCLLYWTLYGSIKRLCKYIVEASRVEKLPHMQHTGIREFDSILDSFYEYQDKNTKLMYKVNEKEKLAQQLRYEKLLLQINPHFIHNSLNSIQWMARLNHQPQIESMVNSLLKVFNYNLNENVMSNLHEEIVAIQAYMDLQAIRYGDKISVDYHIESDDYKLPIPRFLMQPMMENAILYGMDEAGCCHIIVSVQRDTDNTYLLCIQDGGNGFSDSLREKILMGEISRGNGLGIGLRYVLSVLQYYNGEIRAIETNENGTTISIVLRSQREEENA